MKAIRQHVHGRLFEVGGHAGLLLADVAPTVETGESLYLRYAFILRGIEETILPAFVLDDWGSEIKGLGLYEWVGQFGDQFPRAELFGYDLRGREIQCFLRELELHARLLCLAYPHKETPLGEGVLLEAILLADESVSAPVAVRRPPALPRPLPSVKAGWWLAHPTTSDFRPIFI